MPDTSPDLSFTFRSSRVTRSLFGILAVLVMLHLLVAFCHFALHKPVAALTELLDMDLEANLPTFYNCFLFFAAAPLFLLAGRTEATNKRWPWRLMAFIFIFLGIDEGSQIHEKLMLFMLRMMNNGHQANVHMGWLYYAWVIPYIVAAGFLGIVLLRWLVKLPSTTRTNLIISGIVYVTGAVFMEMWSGKVAESLDSVQLSADVLAGLPCEVYPGTECHLYANAAYVAIYTLEETMEMAGLILCIGTLMKHLGTRGLRLFVTIPRNGE